MKDLSRVKYTENGRPYVEYLIKSGKQKGYIRKWYGQVIICQNCQEKCFVRDDNIKVGRGRFCSRKCEMQGKTNPNWKGGKRKDYWGYVLCWKPEHPYANNLGYVREHRLVMEKYLGRYLTPEERIHHKNGILDDNRIENLQLFKDDAEHAKHHAEISKG